MKGGYTIIDLGGYNFTAGTSHTVPGVHARIANNYGKPCQLTGIKVGSAEIKDQWLNIEKSGTSFIAQIAKYKVTITSDDGVTFETVAAPLAAPTWPAGNGTYTMKGTKDSSGFTYSWVKDT